MGLNVVDFFLDNAMLLLYGCGPNVIIGGVGASAYTILLFKDYFKPSQSQKDLKEHQYSRADDLTNYEFNRKVEIVKTFAISAIPLFGPCLAWKKIADSHGAMLIDA